MELRISCAKRNVELFNYEVQIINFKVQTSNFKEYSIACNALAGANIKAKEEVPLTNGRKLQIINFKVQTSKFKEYKYNIVQ